VRVKHILHQNDIGQGMIELRVAELCADRKISRNRLAKLTGLTRPTAYLLFRGDPSRLNMDTIARLCHVFNLSPDSFITYVPRSVDPCAQASEVHPLAGSELHPLAG